MFDIQECKFNKTVTAIEPNLIIGVSYHKELMETEDDFRKSEICDIASHSVLELYTDVGYIRINKSEAINIAKHFELNVSEINK